MDDNKLITDVVNNIDIRELVKEAYTAVGALHEVMMALFNFTYTMEKCDGHRRVFDNVSVWPVIHAAQDFSNDIDKRLLNRVEASYSALYYLLKDAANKT